jgi:hypothetical protein
MTLFKFQSKQSDVFNFFFEQKNEQYCLRTIEIPYSCPIVTLNFKVCSILILFEVLTQPKEPNMRLNQVKSHLLRKMAIEEAQMCKNQVVSSLHNSQNSSKVVV